MQARRRAQRTPSAGQVRAARGGQRLGLRAVQRRNARPPREGARLRGGDVSVGQAPERAVRHAPDPARERPLRGERLLVHGLRAQRRGVGHGLLHAGIEPAKEGEYLVAQEIARMVKVGVGRILAPGNPPRRHIGFQRGAGNAQKRTNPVARQRAHGGQPFRAAAVRQVQQQRFGLVLPLVCQRDFVRAAACSKKA